MKWSSVFSFFIGILLAALLLVAGGVFAAKYFIAKLTTPPPRPVWANEKSTGQPAKAQSTAAKPKASPTPKASAKPSPSPKATPAGSYMAKVTQQIGLVLRDNPSQDSTAIGGIEYNQRVLVLGDSPDREWQRVRIVSETASTGDEDSAEPKGPEGWVKRGNTERIN